MLGARGLRSICETIMMDLMFDAPSNEEKDLLISLEYAQNKIDKESLARLKAS